jgi:hypothetical protein
MVPSEQTIRVRVVNTSEEISGTAGALSYYTNNVLANADVLEICAQKSTVVITARVDQRMVVFDEEE